MIPDLGSGLDSAQVEAASKSGDFVDVLRRTLGQVVKKVANQDLTPSTMATC
jgi:hypothetical protein